MTRKIFIAFTVVALAFATVNVDAKTVRKTKGGGPHGFDTTYEETHGNDKLIICEGAGYTDCPKATIFTSEQSLMDYAIAQIQSGNLVGSYSDPTSGIGVDWSSDTPIMNNSEITVE